MARAEVVVRIADLQEWQEVARKCQEVARIVAAQAEDEGLWFEPGAASEAYLQQELRRLHAAVEHAAGVAP